MLNFRYVLHLHDGDSERIIRHASFQALAVGAVISVPGKGDWIVCSLATSDSATFNDGIAICEPATNQRRSA